ncbi:MAG: hypothetical protein ACRCUF_14060, partial [Aeromonas sobria]
IRKTVFMNVLLLALASVVNILSRVFGKSVPIWKSASSGGMVVQVFWFPFHSIVLLIKIR